MSPKDYGIRITNPDLGLLFHLLFTEEEFEKTKLFLGSIELTTRKGDRQVDYLDAKYITLKDLLMVMRGE